MPESYVPVSIFIMAPGAFFVLALLTAIQNKVKISGERRGKDMSKIQSGCSSDCMNCADSGCARRLYDEKADGAAAHTAQKTEPEELTIEEIKEEDDNG